MMPNQKPVSRIPKLSYNRMKAEIHMDNDDCQSVTSSSCAESISSTTSTISTRTTGSRLTVASLRRKSRLPDIRSPNTRKAGLGHHHGRIVGVTARRSSTNTNNNVNSRTRGVSSSSYRNDGKSLDRNTNISNDSDVGKGHYLHQTTGNRTIHKSGAATQQDTHTGITCTSPIDTHKGSIGAGCTQSPSPTMPNSKNDKKGPCLPNRPRIGQTYGGRDDRSCGYSISSTRRTRLHADHTTCTTSSPYQEVTPSTPTRISALQKKKIIGIQSSGMRGGARRVQVNYSSSNPKKISSRKVRDSMNSNPKPKHGNVTTAHVAASVPMPVPVPVPVTPEADSSKLQSTLTTRFHNAGSDSKMNHMRIVSPTQTPPSETLPTFKLISSKSSMNSKRLSSARRVPISSSAGKQKISSTNSSIGNKQTKVRTVDRSHSSQQRKHTEINGIPSRLLQSTFSSRSKAVSVASGGNDSCVPRVVLEEEHKCNVDGDRAHVSTPQQTRTTEISLLDEFTSSASPPAEQVHQAPRLEDTDVTVVFDREEKVPCSAVSLPSASKEDAVNRVESDVTTVTIETLCQSEKGVSSAVEARVQAIKKKLQEEDRPDCVLDEYLNDSLTSSDDSLLNSPSKRMTQCEIKKNHCEPRRFFAEKANNTSYDSVSEHYRKDNPRSLGDHHQETISQDTEGDKRDGSINPMARTLCAQEQQAGSSKEEQVHSLTPNEAGIEGMTAPPGADVSFGGLTSAFEQLKLEP